MLARHMPDDLKPPKKEKWAKTTSFLCAGWLREELIKIAAEKGWSRISLTHAILERFVERYDGAAKKEKVLPKVLSLRREMYARAESLTLASWLRKRLDEIAEETGHPRGEVVHYAFEEFVQNYRK